MAAAAFHGCRSAPQASRSDYPSRIAWRAGLPLEQFLLDNIDTITDLDAPLTGLTFRVCNPSSGMNTKKQMGCGHWLCTTVT
jgi:hypothetical protein